MMRRFERNIAVDDPPAAEDLAAYVHDIRDILHATRRGIKYREQSPGTEFMLLGGIDEWSPPDAKHRTRLERSRHYSFAHIELGSRAHRLLGLTCDSVAYGDMIETTRSFYWFMWHEEYGALESQRVVYHVQSPPTSAYEVLNGNRTIMILEPNTPIRRNTSFEPVDKDVFTLLVSDTHEFGNDLIESLAA